MDFPPCPFRSSFLLQPTPRLPHHLHASTTQVHAQDCPTDQLACPFPTLACGFLVFHVCVNFLCSFFLFPLHPPFFLSFNYSVSKIRLLPYSLLGTLWGIWDRVETRADGLCPHGTNIYILAEGESKRGRHGERRLSYGLREKKKKRCKCNSSFHNLLKATLRQTEWHLSFSASWLTKNACA